MTFHFSFFFFFFENCRFWFTNVQLREQFKWISFSLCKLFCIILTRRGTTNKRRSNSLVPLYICSTFIYNVFFKRMLKNSTLAFKTTDHKQNIICSCQDNSPLIINTFYAHLICNLSSFFRYFFAFGESCSDSFQLK